MWEAIQDSRSRVINPRALGRLFNVLSQFKQTKFEIFFFTLQLL